MSRPILPWRSPLVSLPTDNKEVWIRRLPFYDKPVLALYVYDGTFHVTVPTTDPANPTFDAFVPYYTLHSWKHRYLADEQAAFPPP